MGPIAKKSNDTKLILPIKLNSSFVSDNENISS